VPSLADVQALLVPAAPFLRALAAVVAAIYAGRWLRSRLRGLDRLDETLRDMLEPVIPWATLLLALPVVFDAFGWNVASLVAIVSTAGIAIAVALKDSLSNVASGMILLVTRPFRDGDHVTVAGVTGRVVKPGLLTTGILTADERLVTITNDKVLAGPMERHNATARVELILRVARASADAALLARIEDAARTLPNVEMWSVSPMEIDDALARVVVLVAVPRVEAGAARTELYTRVNALLPAAVPATTPRPSPPR
jgi:small conductance mechanosensitive channel